MTRPETDEAYEEAVKAAREAYEVAYDAGLDSDIASCAPWFGWHAAIKAAVPHLPGARPEIPGVSTGKDNEEMYRLEAARQIQVAATDLLRVAERLDRHAAALASFDGGPRRSAFPHAASVRGALNDYRDVSTVIMRLDSALDAAMQADAEGIQRRMKSVQDHSDA